MKVEDIERHLGFRIGLGGIEFLVFDQAVTSPVVRAVQPVVSAEHARRLYGLLLQVAVINESMKARIRLLEYGGVADAHSVKDPFGSPLTPPAGSPGNPIVPHPAEDD